MSKAAAPDTQVRKQDFPLVDRCMELRKFQRVAARAAGDGEGGDAQQLPPLATAEMVFTTGAPVLRYDWSNGRYYMEELVVEEGAIRLDRLSNGAPLLNTHDSWDLEAVLGVVDTPAIADGAGTCSVTFSRRDSVAGYVQDVEDRVIRNVSVGYVRHAMEMIAPSEEAGVWRYRVTDWEPYEVSLVPVPADAGAQVRSADGQPPKQPEGTATRTFPCQIKEVPPTVGTTAATQTRKDVTMTPEEQAAAAAAEKARNDAAAAAAATAERQRAADITDICTRAKVPAEKMSKYIADGTAVEEVRKQVFDEMVQRDAGGERNVIRVYTVNDETKTRLAGIEEAIAHRVDAKATLTDNGRQYRGMTLLEIGREHLERCGVSTRGMARMQLAGAILQHRSGGMLATSDFASLLANVANKRLRQAYEENMPSYQRWARRAPDAPDFKAMTVVNLAGAPDLLQVNEHGEFKYGAMTDGKETYSLLTYGRIVSLTRPALVNDDLRGFDRLVGGFGNAAARLENRTVYSILTTNAALGDSLALFEAGTHKNLDGAGAVISVASLTAGRAAMRVQKGLQNEELNLAPRFLITPAALEQVAYQYTSANYVPTQPSQVNEFKAGGRTALEVVVEAVLDASSNKSWYLAADNAQVDTVEYCYLEGAAGPVIESDVGFEVDGISYKARLDFAAKAIDYRGLYKNAGA